MRRGRAGVGGRWRRRRGGAVAAAVAARPAVLEVPVIWAGSARWPVRVRQVDGDLQGGGGAGQGGQLSGADGDGDDLGEAVGAALVGGAGVVGAGRDQEGCQCRPPGMLRSRRRGLRRWRPCRPGAGPGTASGARSPLRRAGRTRRGRSTWRRWRPAARRSSTPRWVASSVRWVAASSRTEGGSARTVRWIECRTTGRSAPRSALGSRRSRSPASGGDRCGQQSRRCGRCGPARTPLRRPCRGRRGARLGVDAAACRVCPSPAASKSASTVVKAASAASTICRSPASQAARSSGSQRTNPRACTSRSRQLRRSRKDVRDLRWECGGGQHQRDDLPRRRMAALTRGPVPGVASWVVRVVLRGSVPGIEHMFDCTDPGPQVKVSSPGKRAEGA